MIWFKTLMTLENLFLMILGGISAGFLISSIGMNEIASSMPRAVSIVALLLIIYTLVGKMIAAIRLGETSSPAPRVGQELVQGSGEKPIKGIPWLMMFLICLLYPLLMFLAGFEVSTITYCGVVGVLLKRRWWKTLLFSVPYSLAMSLLFQNVLKVSLPEGVIWKAWLG